MAKPIKILKLHYPMIYIVVYNNIACDCCVVYFHFSGPCLFFLLLFLLLLLLLLSSSLLIPFSFVLFFCKYYYFLFIIKFLTSFLSNYKFTDHGGCTMCQVHCLSIV